MRVSSGEMDVCVHETWDDDLVGKVDFQGARLVQRRSGSIGSHADYFMAPRDYSHVVVCPPARSIEQDPTTKNPLLKRCKGRRRG
jgi:hypothetical protein